MRLEGKKDSLALFCGHFTSFQRPPADQLPIVTHFADRQTFPDCNLLSSASLSSLLTSWRTVARGLTGLKFKIQWWRNRDRISGWVTWMSVIFFRRLHRLCLTEGNLLNVNAKPYFKYMENMKVTRKVRIKKLMDRMTRNCFSRFVRFSSQVFFLFEF